MSLCSRFTTTAVLLLMFSTSSVAAVAPPGDVWAVNPLRLGYIHGSVSFWRPGAEDWVVARINTPLTAGDALYSGNNSELELQAGSRAFIRADDNTQISLVNQSPDFLQLKVTAGRVSLDLHALPTTLYTIELDTPNAVFTIDRAGYYRVDVDGDVHFVTRNGGRATLVSVVGKAMSILPAEEIVIHGEDATRAESYVAPEPDAWDRWNYNRTSALIDAVSERYLSPGIAGADDLDHYGDWRISDDYGPVWVPDNVPAGWVPYSAGQWIWDPVFQWTWIDDQPWGWVPFHYGRWVTVQGYWSWCPGPVTNRRVDYAPALVAFYGVKSRTSVDVFGNSGVSWIALGWGEPLVPWWGRQGFIGRPWWGGWGGPRIVNNVVIRQESRVNINNIIYANSRVPNAMISSSSEHFGRGHMHEHSDQQRPREQTFEHVRGQLPVTPNSGSLVIDAPRGARPPTEIISRPVISTRKPQETKLPWHPEAAVSVGAEPHYVPAPKTNSTDFKRPEFGTQTGLERTRPGLPPHYDDWKHQVEPVTPNEIGHGLDHAAATGTKPPQAAPAETLPQARNVESLPPPVKAAPQQDVAAPIRKERDFVSSPAPQTRTPPTDRQSPAQKMETVAQQPQNHSQEEKTFPRVERESAKPPQPVTEHAKQIQGTVSATQPNEGNAHLPGVPANRTYRDARRGTQEIESPRK